jgi:hypothetical protein
VLLVMVVRDLGDTFSRDDEVRVLDTYMYVHVCKKPGTTGTIAGLQTLRSSVRSTTTYSSGFGLGSPYLPGKIEKAII